MAAIVKKLHELGNGNASEFWRDACPNELGYSHDWPLADS